MMRAPMLRFPVVSESFAQFLTPEKLACGLSLSLKIYQCETYWSERGLFKGYVDSTVRKTMRWESFVHRNSRESGFTFDKTAHLCCRHVSVVLPHSSLATAVPKPIPCFISDVMAHFQKDFLQRLLNLLVNSHLEK